MAAQWETLRDPLKLEWMEKAVKYLALKPDLLDDVKSDQQLVDRVKRFAKLIYDMNPYPN